MGNLQDFARNELKRSGYFDNEGMFDGMIGEAVMRMIDVFADEGHSGFSASLAISLFQKVANFEPLTPLTGEEDEWNDISDDSFHAFAITEPDEESLDIINTINAPKKKHVLFQNKRCSRVFKDEKGAYDIQGIVFQEPNGACFTSSESYVYITFPYVPNTKYVKRGETK